MQELEIEGRKYRTGKLDAFKQYHLMRKLLPLLSGLGETFSERDPTVQRDFWKALAPIAQAISDMSVEDSEWLLKTCLSVVTTHNGRAWIPITTAQGSLMFEDIEMSTMVQLAFAAIQDNLGSFFPVPQPNGSDLTAPLSPSLTSA
jgi:hypothetical protein